MGNFLKELKGIGIGRETSFGALGTISEWVNAKTAEFNLEIPTEPVNEMINSREIQKTYQKSRTLSPTLTFDLEPENGAGVILRSFFGTVADVGASGTFTPLAYKHTFTLRQGADVDSMFARYTQAGATMKNYIGLVPNKIGITYPKDDNVALDVNFVGQNEAVGTNTTGTYGTFTPYLSTGDVSVLIDGTANTDITNLKVNLDNGAKGIITLGTNESISKAIYGKEVVDGSFDIYFADETERNKFLNKTASRLQINLTGPTIAGTAKNEFNVKLPKVEYVSFPFGDIDGVIGAAVGFKAIYGANATGTGCVIVEIQNSKTSY